MLIGRSSIREVQKSGSEMSNIARLAISKKDWLLLFLATTRAGTSEIPDADPIRIQKGMFLFTMESGIPNKQRYEFHPYNYGACSFEIYRDLDLLVAQGYLEKLESQRRSWPFYRVTQKGMEKAEQLRKIVPQTAGGALADRKEFTFSHSFFDMLREIYKRYPKYAQRSVLKFG